MHYQIQPRAKRTLAERHIDDLIEVLGELLTVPELFCFEPDEMFDHTLEVMAKARVIRAAVLDEIAEMGAS
ncbi:MAG TPA: hypothetical protein VG028_05530 [Terriglobia bacterium]|nr:hypothetical protein [Terriglobia bacterium]